MKLLQHTSIVKVRVAQHDTPGTAHTIGIAFARGTCTHDSTQTERKQREKQKQVPGSVVNRVQKWILVNKM